jgi:2-C-methyl-D-erythritol 4-phosphate cytidylyltransferase
MKLLNALYELYNLYIVRLPLLAVLSIQIPKTYTTAILLAAGTSTRFNHKTPKQLVTLANQPLFTYSLETLATCQDIDHLIVVTNPTCYQQITDHINKQPYKIPIKVLKVNTDTRMASISSSLQFINDHIQQCTQVLIHDAARPFITQQIINQCLSAMPPTPTDIGYVQTSLKLTNGLVQINPKLLFLNRDDFIEVCTPHIMSFPWCYRVLQDHGTTIPEFLPYYTGLGKSPTFIYGSYNELRKITVAEDLIGCE